MEYITITRKYALIPASSDRNEWNKRVYSFTIEDLARKIEYYSEKIKKKKAVKRKNRSKQR